MPNTIADNFQRLVDAKNDIADAITAKGGTVNSGDGLEEFAADIATIESGTSPEEALKSTTPQLIKGTSEFSTYIWETKTWNNAPTLYKTSGRNSIWTDGTNIYNSNGSSHHVLDKDTSTWYTKTWNGLTYFFGHSIWTDGNDIYYSNGSSQYVLDKATSTWSAKIWNGFSPRSGIYIWTDGNDIYFSYRYDSDDMQYVLDKDTSTWVVKTWGGLDDVPKFSGFKGNNIWTDGVDIYYSGYYNNRPYTYKLNKKTSVWSSPADYTGVIGDGNLIWTDGRHIYAAGYTVSEKYMMLPGTKCFSKISDSNLSFGLPTSENIWTDGDNIYSGFTSVMKKIQSIDPVIKTTRCIKKFDE